MQVLQVSVLTPEIYTSIYPFLKTGVEWLNDEKTLPELIQDIQSGNKQLWLFFRGKKLVCVVVTAIVFYPSGKRLLYYLVTGKYIDECLKNRTIIEDWARAQDCVKVEFYGRLGWKKKLEKWGYQFDHICMHADL